MTGASSDREFTFVFTDIEGSTRLWEDHADAMAAALRTHDEVIRRRFERAGGAVFSNAGDAFAAAFEDPRAAVGAAQEIQDALAETAWPSPVEVRVRVGVHMGRAELRDGNYFGTAVNRAARVADAGHGGQILLTDQVIAAVPDLLTVDLGRHLLKSLDEPIRIHELGQPDGRSGFPPLRSVGATTSTIPQVRDPLVGRSELVDELVELTSSRRLITIVGPGGSGKTRLAIEVGNRLVGPVVGGVFFADLSAVHADDLIPSAIADGLGLTLGGTGSALDAVVEVLSGREAMLVVDNCEQVIDGVAEIVDRLLRACPTLSVLATSQETIEIPGEYVIRLGGLAETDGVALFRLRAERAGADVDDLETVALICRQLDGLPLAIELAASRTALLSVGDIARGLEDRFTLLMSGRRPSFGRHRTLRAAVEWSYDLLTDEEQVALRALGYFPAHFGLTLAAAVLDVDPGRAIELLNRLVARSLVQSDPEAGDPHHRYRLLETIKAYAGERLREAGEEDLVARRHADGLLGMIDGEFYLIGSDLVSIDDDVLAALDFARRCDDLELGCNLAHLGCDALAGRGAFARARELLDWVTSVEDAETRAKMWSIAAWIYNWSMSVAEAVDAAINAVDAAPSSTGAAAGRINRATVLASSSPEMAQLELDLAMPIIQASDDVQLRLRATWQQVVTSMWNNDLDRATDAAVDFHRSARAAGVGRNLARAALLTVSCATRDTERIAEILDGEFLGPEHVDRLSSLGKWIIHAPDAMGLAVLGDVAGARRSLANMWDDRSPVSIPLINADVLLGLAVCSVEAGEIQAAHELLEGNTWLNRYGHTANFLYRTLATIAGVDPEDAEWRLGEFVRRLAWADDIAAENRDGRAIDAELHRLGLR